MRYFTLVNDKIAQYRWEGRLVTRVWVEAGTYPVVREFDADRWLVDIGRTTTKLTVLNKGLGSVQVINEPV